MQSEKNNLLKISRAEANKWIRYGLKKNEEEEVNILLAEENEDNLIESFHKKLEFGTGGMRGLIGIGSNRINSYTISLATQGLCNYLNKDINENKSAVIAYDSRRFSKEFGYQTAKIFSANNIKTFIFSELRPTPELSFAVRELNCSCGIVITASHNPKEYNGYKVYWNDGGVWVNKRKPEQTELEYQMRNWYYFNWICGDHILEQHIHNIDVANWFIGEYPSTAQGMGGREVRNGKDHGHIFDHHFVEFHYPGGAVISSQCRHQKNTMRRVDEVFQGTKGSITLGSGEIRDLSGNLKFSYPKNNYWESDDEPNPYQVEHDKLFKSIREGNVISDAENGAKSTLSAIMGRMATYTGKKITWDEIMNSKESLVPDNLSWNSTPPILPDEDGNYDVPVPGKTKFI